jgi:hypothetical protein
LSGEPQQALIDLLSTDVVEAGVEICENSAHATNVGTLSDRRAILCFKVVGIDDAACGMRDSAIPPRRSIASK